jgi:shikimate kinase
MSSGPGVFLMGLRGSGKSTLGCALAEELELPFTDSDEELERENRRSCARMLEEDGIESFRQAEARLYLRLGPRLHLWPCVLALGGGTLEAPGVQPLMEALKARGGWVGVWLEAAPEVLAARSDGASRPRLLGRSAEEEARLLLARRGASFARLSDLRFETGSGNVTELARELAASMRQRGVGQPC